MVREVDSQSQGFEPGEQSNRETSRRIVFYSDYLVYALWPTVISLYIKNVRVQLPLAPGPVLGRFDRFNQIGPRTLRGPALEGVPFCTVRYKIGESAKS